MQGVFLQRRAAHPAETGYANARRRRSPVPGMGGAQHNACAFNTRLGSDRPRACCCNTLRWSGLECQRMPTNRAGRHGSKYSTFSGFQDHCYSVYSIWPVTGPDEHLHSHRPLRDRCTPTLAIDVELEPASVSGLVFSVGYRI